MDVRGYGLSTRPAQMNVNATLNGPIVRTSDAAADVKTVVDFIFQKRGISQHVALGWSWGTSIMSTYTSLNPSRVSKLVIYAPQWFRAANTAPTTAYRTITRQAAYDRWVNGVAVVRPALHAQTRTFRPFLIFSFRLSLGSNRRVASRKYFRHMVECHRGD